MAGPSISGPTYAAGLELGHLTSRPELSTVLAVVPLQGRTTNDPRGAQYLSVSHRQQRALPSTGQHDGCSHCQQ